MKSLFFLLTLFIVSPLAYSKTVSSVAISPQGAVLQSGSTLQFSATCVYSDGSADNCAASGGVTWTTSRATSLTVSSTGLAKAATDPGAGSVGTGLVLASAGGATDRANVFSQHPGDTFYQYMTPDYRIYQTSTQPTAVRFPMNVVLGSTVALGSGIVVNYNGPTTGVPFNSTCNWISSDPANATVSKIGLVTAVASGSVNITCGRAGNGVFGTSGTSGWVAPGNVITLNIVAGGTGSQTWYVRPGGGTPFVSAATTPAGQCDGKHDADYPGSGVNQPCALGNIRYLWTDQTTYYQEKWIISGGDTVIVRKNPNGYNTGLDANANGAPVNCNGDGGNCFMPTIPSGTAARHTRILGENYASCSSDSAKTLLHGTWGAYTVFNTTDSQFVDVACFEVTDAAACASSGAYTNTCRNGTYNAAGNGILQSALTASVNYTDLFIHGLGSDGIHGASGAGIVADRVHIRAMPNAGINMDDNPWQVGNISVAGGFTLKNSITEFSGCVEEYPVVHNYPYIECRDQNTGGYADGFGTASATGDWLFDHDTWRYNFQDGLDLLHSGLNSLTVTNSTSYGNDGQQFKIGSGLMVVFRNNLTLHNCARIGQTIGDEPASAILPGVALCRAAGDGIPIAFDGQGTDLFQNNTYVGYGATSYDLMCTGGWDSCPNTKSVFQNNINIGITNMNPALPDHRAPGLFYTQGTMPANQGWAVRDHNLYFGFRNGCPALNAGEICADAKFIGEPPLTISSETVLDNFNFNLSSASAARGSGISIPGLLTDILGLTRLNLPSMGAIEFGGSTAAPPASSQPTTLTLGITPSSMTVGQTATGAVSVVSIGGVVPTGTISLLNGASLLGTATLNSSGIATLALPSLTAGTYAVTASYVGDSNYAAGVSSAVTLTVNNSVTSPPSGGIRPPSGGNPSTGGTSNPSGSVTPPPVPPSAVSILVAQPDYGFNVIPGSTRRIFATVTNGRTNQVAWRVKSGSAQISSGSGSWIDVTAPATGSSCSITGTSAKYAVASATQFTIQAASVDDGSKTADVTFNVCKPAVEVSVVPFYRTVYSNQPVDIQSLVLGATNQNVHWAITSQPRNGDGSLADSTSRDSLFTAAAPGRYQLTATSVADGSKSATAIVYVTGHTMPYRVTPSQTQPVDCSVDPAMLGTVYEVGPSQSFKTLAAVPFPTMEPGSTVRLHNEDVTGLHPTEYHEYVQISRAATADQPFRLCGLPDRFGNLPIIDGANATGRSDTDAAVAGTGLLTLHSSNGFTYWPAFSGPQYIAIEGIQFRNAKTGNSYRAPGGSAKTWQNTSSCIQVDDAQNIAFVGDDIGSCSSGVMTQFNSNGGWGASDVNLLWEGNHIHNNGVAGSKLGHQMYLQSWGNVVQFNRI
ncbi:MAG: Ig-like domain repeat protein, partial [Chthonomonadales bacterium]